LLENKKPDLESGFWDQVPVYSPVLIFE